jgi:hypothetical protein
VKQNVQGIVLEHSLSCWWEQQNQQNYVTGNYVVVSNQPCLWCSWQEILWMCLSCLSRYFKDWCKGAFMQFLTKYEWAPRLIKLSAKTLQRVNKVLLRNSWQSMGGLHPRLSEPVTRRSSSWASDVASYFSITEGTSAGSGQVRPMGWGGKASRNGGSIALMETPL